MSLYSRKKKNAQYDLEKAFGSYSGMFANLTKVFLLLYVVVTLQNLTMSVATQYQTQVIGSAYKKALEKVIASFEQQLRTYQLEKEQYLKGHAPPGEAEAYRDAMRKLAALEDEKKVELEEKVAALKDSEEKLNELTSYKSLLRNIIDSKYVVQAKLQEISQVKADVERQKQASDAALARLRSTYDQRLRAQVRSEELKLEKDYAAKVAAKDRQIEAEKKQLASEKSRYNRQQVAVINAKLTELERERRALKTDLAAKSAAKERELAARYAENQRQAQRKYEGRLAQQKSRYDGQLSGVKGDLSKTKGELASARQSGRRYLASIGELKGENTGLRGDVETLKALKTGREKAIGEMAGALRGAFARGGVGAETNLESGEVVIFFPDTFFDYGSASLKPEMKQALTKALPVYADTLFGNPKFAKRIDWIEIIGFASPTFRGEYVTPESMAPEARRALNYNMDLSYRRAKAIFEYIFDPGQVKFSHQKPMVLRTKVAGRSYLAARMDARKPAGAPASGPMKVCEKFNCAAEQRVAIRFHLVEPVSNRPEAK